MSFLILNGSGGSCRSKSPNRRRVTGKFHVLLDYKNLTCSRVVIIPGQFQGDVRKTHWYAWVKDEVQKQVANVEVVLNNMPDQGLARESIWLPFMRDQLHVDERTLLIGHGTGAQAAMRYAEKYHIWGLVLISACITDRGHGNDKATGYYGRPWEWELIRKNANMVLQFASADDPKIPIAVCTLRFSRGGSVAEW